MPTTTKKVGESTTDSFIILATPKEKAFSDGSTIRVIQDCQLTEALHILRIITGADTDPNYADFKLNEVSSVMLIHGAVVPMTTDMSAVDVDGTQYKLKENNIEFVTEFINTKE